MGSTVPIRLAYLVSQYPAVNHTYVLREIRGLRELGMEVHVISIRPADRPWDQLARVEQAEARSTFVVLRAGALRIAGDHLFTLLRHPVRYVFGLVYAVALGGANLRAMISNFFYFAEAVVAGRQLQRLALTHVHSHFSSTVALLASRVFAIPFSVTIHGPAEFDDPLGFYLREKVARAQFVRAISDYGAGELRKVSAREDWSKIEVIPLGVDTSAFEPAARRHDGRLTQLLCVASLSYVKGHAVLIAAVERLVRDGGILIHLRLVGDGPLRPQLERTIAERGLTQQITLEGACDQERVMEFYRQADLFVLPSFAEGVPVVLMEAMAMTVPSLATRITGIPELIRHGIDGWLVTPGDEQELAGAVAMLADDAELRQRLGRAGRARVIEQYDLAANVKRLAEVFAGRLRADGPASAV